LKNIIITGDSFCHIPKAEHRAVAEYQHKWDVWPESLAKKLNLNLICQGFPGELWWQSKVYLDNMDPDVKNNTEFLIICHTHHSRIANSLFNKHQVRLKPENDDKLNFYHTYIYLDTHAAWCQQQWMKEVSINWNHVKQIHLHGFRETLLMKSSLSGVNVVPCLTALSLNELGGTSTMDLGVDTRANHFNQFNNDLIAEELYQIVVNHQPGTVKLDPYKFDAKTHKWLDWQREVYREEDF
jgi:hypothetical protein